MFLRITRTRRHRSVGSEKVPRKLIVTAGAPKKCAHKHIRASCSPPFCNVRENLSSRAVDGGDVNEAIAENLGACHQDEKLKY